MNAAEIIMLLLRLSIFLTALGFGLRATPADAFYLFRKPVQLLRTILAMNIIMPLIAIFLIFTFELKPLVSVVLIAISVSPLPPLLPQKTLKSGGSESYSIGLLVSASLLSVLLIPFTLGMLEKLLHKQVEIPILDIVIAVLATVILPLFLGICLRYFMPALSEKASGLISKIAQFMLLFSILPILFFMFPEIVRLAGNGSILVLVLFVIAGTVVGHFLGGPSAEEQSVLALATGARHPAIAMTLASGNLSDPKHVPAIILLYLLICAIVLLPYQKWSLKKNRT